MILAKAAGISSNEKLITLDTLVENQEEKKKTKNIRGNVSLLRNTCSCNVRSNLSSILLNPMTALVIPGAPHYAS